MLFTATLLICVSASRAFTIGSSSNSVNLPNKTHFANWGAVSRKFSSAFKSSVLCPDTIDIRKVAKSKRKVSCVALSDMWEDGQRCSGVETDNMRIVTQATEKRPTLFRDLGFDGLADSFDKPGLAADVVTNNASKNSLLVGFDEAVRKCVASTNSADPLFFFIRDHKTYEIRFRLEESEQVFVSYFISVSPNVAALFIGDRYRVMRAV